MLSGIERAVFGDVDRGTVDAWLRRHVRDRLGAEVVEVVFRSGRIAVVQGVRLDDGTTVVVKVHRDGEGVARLAVTSRYQRVLADGGYPCPVPVDGPAVRDGRVVMIESVLDRGASPDGHDPAVRRAMARSLAVQVDALRAVDPAPLVADAPAWARHEHGPWPTPHDPIFDFTTTPPEYMWLDELAGRAADVLAAAPRWADVVGHCDWSCQNVRFTGGAVVATYDWDSLVARPEPVIAGLAAGSFTEGGGAPTPAEAAAFLDDYGTFTPTEHAAAAAAACWVLAYNARCAVAFGGPEDGSALDLLDRHRAAYLHLR